MTFDFIFFEYIFSCEGWYLSIPNQLSLAKRVTHRRTSRVVPHAYLTVVPHASYLTYLTRTVVSLTHTVRTYTTTRPPHALDATTLLGEPAHCATLDCDQKDAILFFLDAVRWLFKSYMAGVDGEQGAEAGDHGEPASMRTLK